MRHVLGGGVQVIRPFAGMQHVLRAQRHVQRFAAAGEDVHRHARFGGAAQASGEQRLLLAQPRAHHQHSIAFSKLFNALPQPCRAFQAA